MHFEHIILAMLKFNYVIALYCSYFDVIMKQGRLFNVRYTITIHFQRQLVTSLPRLRLQNKMEAEISDGEICYVFLCLENHKL